MSKWNSLRKKRDKKFKQAILLLNKGDSESKQRANKIKKRLSK